MPKKAPTEAESEYMNKVAALGCCICGMPAQVHHVSSGGMGLRSSHYDTIPLCPDHHQNGGHGVAIHAGKDTWEMNYGREVDILAQVKARLAGDT